MSTEPGAALHDVADSYPQIPTPPPGLFERARRAQRRRRVAASLAVVALVAIGVSVRLNLPAYVPANNPGVARMPSHFVESPKWTASVTDAPIARALLAFVVAGQENQLTLVGPEDRYRTFALTGERASDWAPSFLLSPNGQYLMTPNRQQTELLNIASGRSRTLPHGAPLAWSPDGTQAVLVSFDGNGFPSIHVIDVANGNVLWRVALPLANRKLTAALSPNGESLAIQHSGDLSVYRREGKQWTKPVGAQLQLAGQLAWHPAGNVFALSHQTKTTALNLIDANTGEVAGSVPGGGFLGYVGEQGRTEGLPSVSGWIEGAPIVNSGNRALVRLGTPSEVLMTTAEHTNEFQAASAEVNWLATDPGAPEPGPAVYRYRPVISIAVPIIVCMLTLGIWIMRRRRWR
ncbi:MAG TPA: hypothetical protein DGT23_25930 [Micromonosporaceae bacterium]|nr:hypothetical protein [Micromonosporaceae bacterium]